MIDPSKGETEKQSSEEGELVVQELFFESYSAPNPQGIPAEPEAPKEELATEAGEEVDAAERKGLVRRAAKSVFLGLLMLGSLVFAGITMLGRRRRPSMVESFRRRFA